jgi:ABC-type polysaccharide/polyol phosphate transport system ATPase subunit
VTGRIVFDGVRKVYRWRGSRVRHESVKGAALQTWLRRRKPTVEEHVALDAIDLEVAAGETVALIGPNGSGKSTLLKLASGILRPTAGTVDVDGRVTALIELGAGFHPEITGRENVVINGMLLGLDRREIEARLPEILEFAGIGDFVDQPVKTYSSGMYVRLGFAVAVAVDPDVLLIDEVLSVGDEAFTRRCLDRLARMHQAGVTMVLVSHDLDLVASFADRAVYLSEGKIRLEGDVDDVVTRYRDDVAGVGTDHPGGREDGSRVIEGGRRWGTGDVEIASVELVTDVGRARLVPSGQPCALEIRYRARREITDVVFGVAWHRVGGSQVAGHNTHLDGLVSRRLSGDGSVRCCYPSLDLSPGDYRVDAAVHATDGLAYDYWCDAARVRITSEVQWPGVWTPPHRWEFDGEPWD